MQADTNDSKASAKEVISPYNIIFSCVICQRTVSDIYPDAKQFPNQSDGRLEAPCKMWIAECTHLTCSEHLEGGGAPFHSTDAPASAPCPLCKRENGDDRPKRLFAIYGPGPNQHDSRIPSEWFIVPPMTLDDQTPVMSALRFQYISLAHYAAMMHKRFNILKSSFKSVSAENAKISQDLRRAELHSISAKEDVESLRRYKRKYIEWKKREPEISHYLKQFSALAAEHADLKSQLSRLGYQVPQTKFAIEVHASESGQSRAKEPQASSNSGQISRVMTASEDRAAQESLHLHSSHWPRGPVNTLKHDDISLFHQENTRKRIRDDDTQDFQLFTRKPTDLPASQRLRANTSQRSVLHDASLRRVDSPINHKILSDCSWTFPASEAHSYSLRLADAVSSTARAHEDAYEHSQHERNRYDRLIAPLKPATQFHQATKLPRECSNRDSQTSDFAMNSKLHRVSDSRLSATNAQLYDMVGMNRHHPLASNEPSTRHHQQIYHQSRAREDSVPRQFMSSDRRPSMYSTDKYRSPAHIRLPRIQEGSAQGQLPQRNMLKTLNSLSFVNSPYDSRNNPVASRGSVTSRPAKSGFTFQSPISAATSSVPVYSSFHRDVEDGRRIIFEGQDMARRIPYRRRSIIRANTRHSSSVLGLPTATEPVLPRKPSSWSSRNSYRLQTGSSWRNESTRKTYANGYYR